MKKTSSMAAALGGGLLALILAAPAWAGGAADAVQVLDPYVRQAPPGAMATAAFMVLKNTGSADTRLVRVANPASATTELHTHLNDGGVMRMRQVADIPVKAGGEAVLQPGGLHVMMIELKSPLKAGDSVPLTLTYADGSSKVVDAPVRAPGAMPAMPGMQHKH